MVPGLQSAVYDEYLEKKMRVVLEALVEGLLTEKPKNVESFALDWLVQYHRDNNPEKDILLELRSERDALLSQRDSLLERGRLHNPGSASSSSLPMAPAEIPAEKPSSKEGSRPGSAEIRPVQRQELAASQVSATREASKEYPVQRQESAGSQMPLTREGSKEDPGVIAAAEAAEQVKMARMKDKDRRAGVSAEAVSKERLENWKKPVYEKSQDSRDRLKNNIKTNDKLQVLFGHLAEKDIEAVIDAMFPKEVKLGDDIIVQGQEGDNFYIVEDGTFDVWVKRGDAPAAKVHFYGPGDMFGELALMYNAQRAATVSATADGKLWGLDRDSFQLMLTTAENTKAKQYEGFLENIAILQDLTKYELGRLSDMLDSQLFDKDEPIITQGEDGNYFYILEDGSAKAYIGGERGEIEVKHYEKPGEYFGEIALLTSATRKATVRAAGEGCSVLSVSRKDFDLVLGPIKDILGKSLEKYAQYADFIREEQSKEAEDAAEKEKINQMKDTSRRQGVSAQAISEERMKDWKKPSYPKPEHAVERLKGYIASNAKLQVLFGHLSEAAVLDVIDAMKPQEVADRERLIEQGAEGESFYIVDEGTFDVFVQRGDNPPGKVLEYAPGGMFGELALMYNAPRAATVISTSNAKVWALDRESFQMMVSTAENTRHTQYEGFLQDVDLFKHLTRYEIAQLSDLLESELFESGEDIVKQGEDGKLFYIVEDGEAKAYITGESGEIEVKHYSKQGDYFGEIALITNGQRKATVRATGTGCSVLSVSREDFDRVLGPIKDMLVKNIDNYPVYADVIREAMNSPGPDGGK